MKISSKGRYAVRVMVELAKHRDEYLSVAELSKMQGITVKYLEKIIGLLSRSGLIAGTRGALGGYTLAVDPKECSIAEILQATDDLPKLAPCLESGVGCDKVSTCDSISCWEKLSALITNYLKSVKIADLVSKKV